MVVFRYSCPNGCVPGQQALVVVSGASTGSEVIVWVDGAMAWASTQVVQVPGGSGSFTLTIPSPPMPPGITGTTYVTAYDVTSFCSTVRYMMWTGAQLSPTVLSVASGVGCLG